MRSCTDYDVAVVRDQSQLQTVLPEWRDLLARNALNSEIFNDPIVIDCALRESAVTPYIVLVRRQGVLHCVAPFAVQQSQFPLRFSVFRLASFPLRTMTLFGSDFVYAANADIRQCCSLVFEVVQQAEFDLSFLYALDSRGGLWEYCEAENGKPRGLRFARPCRHFDKHFRLQLPPSFAEYVSSLGSNTRSSLKRRAKKLVVDHSARLTKVTSADQVRAFLESANAIYQDSWQSKTYGTAKRDRPEEIERLEHIARHGWLCCYLLDSDLGPLAFQIGYLYQDTFYACDFAFARKWSASGPGAVLMYWMLEDLYRDCCPRVVDLGAGDSPQKRTFRGLAFDVGDYWVIPQNRWRHVFVVQRCLSEIEATARLLLVRTGMDNAVRRLLKHKD